MYVCVDYSTKLGFLLSYIIRRVDRFSCSLHPAFSRLCHETFARERSSYEWPFWSDPPKNDLLPAKVLSVLFSRF